MAPPKLPISLRLLLVATLCTSAASAVPAHRIFRRADSCDADQVTCPSILPSNFCCAEDTKCIALAGGTTAVCCPTDQDCSLIKPITCNLSEQNVAIRPNASIKTTVFNVELETCGDGTCCPFGYSCNSDNECIMNDDQSEAPSGSDTSASSTAGPSATSTTNPSSTGTASTTAAPSSTTVPSESSGSDDDSDSNNSGPATTSIIGGVIGGCLVLLVIAIIVFLCIRRRNKGDGSNSEKGGHRAFGHARAASSTGSFGNIISEPITQPNSYRTDFILKSSTPSTVVSRATPPSTGFRNTPSTGSRTLVRSFSNSTRISPTPPRIRISIPNPFNSPSASPGVHSAQPSLFNEGLPRHGNVRLLPIRSMKASSHYCSQRPTTPELQREPSSESINVFADPGTVKARPLTRATTFTDMMDEADLGEVRRGRPYVPGTTPRI
ncbi:hypothetical protein EDB81DRAFT_753217 [Dactylonectria macrodidyma]|uniref:receptor protein-tyrosine kinase n=1 Tax=Dactylonectria macrodidyma TaxID=307937 RepID=A0A9P9JLP2_9HYPO|nr:hypothetical protein EDB81DRAFT_753217 [Dactylonectria macrodidyma]